MFTLDETKELREMFPDSNDVLADEEFKVMGWYIYSLWEKNDFKNEEIIYRKETGDIFNYFFEFNNQLFMLSDESIYWGQGEISIRKVCDTNCEISKNYLKKFIRNVEWINQYDYFEGKEVDFNFELHGDGHEHHVEMAYGLIEILRNKGYKISD